MFHPTAEEMFLQNGRREAKIATMRSPQVLLLFLPLLLGTVSSDRLRFHLENLVNWNVSACDDFYHHACSQNADPNEFFINKVPNFFKEALDRLLPDALKNSPIEFDLQYARTAEFKLEDNNYANLARERCGENMQCYYNEHIFVASVIQSAGTVDIQSATHDDIVAATSNIIDSIIKEINSTGNAETSFRRSIHFHNALQTRISMIEFMKVNCTYRDFHDIEEAGKNLKTQMINNIQSSNWLHADEIGEFILRKIKERIESITITHDFDELDRNLTSLQKLNRDVNEAYFSFKLRTGVRGLDNLLALHAAFLKHFIQAQRDAELASLLARVVNEFGFGAFFYSQTKSALLLATFLDRTFSHSDIIAQPLITYHVLGHELYHSLFSGAEPTLRYLYAHRAECVENHYKKSCKFAMGACASGKQTIFEDAPDLESLRIMQNILRDNYSSTDLETKIDGLETTLEQAFFYYAASAWCEKDSIRPEHLANGDVHSAGNIRVNAAFSLMPEFTKAFGCKKEQAMYVEEQDSCYIFGPNSN